MTTDKGFNQITKTFADNLKRLRIESGMTQEGMVQVGFNYRHYQRLESGKTSPSLYTIYRLSKIFKVNISEFFE